MGLSLSIQCRVPAMHLTAYCLLLLFTSPVKCLHFIQEEVRLRVVRQFAPDCRAIEWPQWEDAGYPSPLMIYSSSASEAGHLSLLSLYWYSRATARWS